MRKIYTLLILLVSFTLVNAQYWRVYDGSTVPLAAPDGENLLTFEDVSDQCHGANFYEMVLEDPAIEGNMLFDYAEPDVEPFPCTSKSTARGMYRDQWSGMSDSSFTVVARLAAKKGLDRVFDFQWRNGNAGTRDELHITAADSMFSMGKSDGEVKVDADLTKWHIIRITVHGDTSKIYLDEAADPVLMSVTSTSNSDQYIKMGDPGGSTFGAYIDYILVDTTGAFDPSQSAIPDGLSTDTGGEMLPGFGKSVMMVTDETAVGPDGHFPDSMFIEDLKAVGFDVVHVPYDSVGGYGDWFKAEVDAVDAVVIGRQVSSGDFQDPPEAEYWEKLQKPVVVMSNYLVRASRLRWFPSSTVINAARFGDLPGKVLMPMDPAFVGVGIPEDSIITYASDNIGMIEIHDSVASMVNGTSLIELVNGPEGYEVSTSENLVTDTIQLSDYDGTPLMMRWEPLDSMFTGNFGGVVPARPFGWRTWITGGDDHDWDTVANTRKRNTYVLSDEMITVFTNEVLYLISLPQPEIDDDATLSALSVSVGELAPAFDPEVNSYVVTVPIGTTSANITAVANSENATVVGDGEFTGVPGIAVVKVTSMAGSVNEYNLVFQEEVDPGADCIPGGAGTLDDAILNAEDGDVILLCNDEIYQIITPLIIDKNITIRAAEYPELPGLADMPLIRNDFAANPVIQFADGGNLTLVGIDIDGMGVSNIINPRAGGVGATVGMEINRCRLHNTASDIINSGDIDQETILAKCIIKNSFLYESGTGHGAYVRNFFGSNDPYVFEDVTFWSLGQQFIWINHFAEGDLQDWNFNHLTGYNLSTSVSDNKELFGNSPDNAELNISMTNTILAKQVSAFEASLNFWATADKNTVTLSNIVLFETSPAVPREGSDPIPVDPLYEDDPQFADPDNGDFTVGNTAYHSAADDGDVLGARYWHPDFVDDFSDVLSTEEISASAMDVFVYPVPFSSELNIEINIERADKASISIIDLSGRTLVLSSYELLSGMNQIVLDASDLQAGTYIYKISTSEITATGSITKIQ